MSMSGHQSARMKSDTWLTPPEILRALGASGDSCDCRTAMAEHLLALVEPPKRRGAAAQTKIATATPV